MINENSQNNFHKNKGLIIGVGFQKTGTSSLREALKVLGFRVKDTTTRALVPILKNDYSSILRMLKNFDAVEDTPWYMIYKELDKLIPNSKFILTIRDEESWYLSVKKHIGNLRSANHEWIYGRGKGLPKDDKKNTINVYIKHNKEVIEYFENRPNDLLVLDFTKGDSWEKICPFLNKEIPKTPFPHYNKTSKNKRKNEMSRFRFWRKQIKNDIRIRYIDLLGLWDK
ncbi:MAG: hypothetical protein ISP69_03670 [Crocinitomicaceae bacterium]|nr:hypothetical protein [Crocinitomicaceae bacterium]